MRDNKEMEQNREGTRSDPAPATSEVRLRPFESRDLPAITAIYRDAVLHGTGSFEIDPPDLSVW
jgi:hypothetical protein